jgi:hypothetical protein
MPASKFFLIVPAIFLFTAVNFFPAVLPFLYFMPLASFAAAHVVRAGVAIYALRDLNIAARGNAL